MGDKIPTKAFSHKIGTKLRLPHPYLTTYFAVPTDGNTNGQSPYYIVQDKEEAKQKPSPIALESSLTFTTPAAPDAKTAPPLNNNTPWARSQRAPRSQVKWTSSQAPSAGQLWIVTYFILIMNPDLELFRLDLQGAGSDKLSQTLVTSMLCNKHPLADDKATSFQTSELTVSRSAFWQGAGSPFGTQSAWTPNSRNSLNIEPGDYTVTTKFPDERIHARHPRRPQKPTPGDVVYSRYIPSLDEHYSLISLDYTNEEHVKYFSDWQNSPRVASAWNQTGTLDEHREYLRKQHHDPHQLCVLARFDDTIMSYFELYWAKEDTLGAYYDADDFDRGRHTMMGDTRYRGPHRVLAWWPCIIHYLFLDDHRTNFVVGEPAATNNTVMMYDFLHGLSVYKYVDFPHKRAVLVKVSREWFFQTAPLYQKGGYIVGTGLPLPSRL